MTPAPDDDASSDETTAPEDPVVDESDSEDRASETTAEKPGWGLGSVDESTDESADDGPEASPSATAPPAIPTAVPAVQETAFPVPTTPPAPPRPTRVPPRPTTPPRPTAVPAPVCPNGQVPTTSGCACPAGTTARASDGRCVRLCNQADLTITNSCVCTGQYYDNGGQCVKICKGGEIPDGFAGCKPQGIAASDN